MPKMWSKRSFTLMPQFLNICQNTLNSCCFSSLASSFESVDKIKAANSISKPIEESSKSQVSFRNRIDIANAVLKTKKLLKVNRNYIIT